MGKTIGLHTKTHNQNTSTASHNDNHNTSNFNMNSNNNNLANNSNNKNTANSNNNQANSNNNPATSNNNTAIINTNNSLNNNRSRSVTAAEAKVANMEAMMKARYFAFNQRRTMPIRVNPVGILFLVFMGGLIFIGITITISAHWPGLSTIGENRLKIAGPIVLCLGVLGCIFSSCFLFHWTMRKNERKAKEMTELAHKHISQSQERSIDSSYQSSLNIPGRQRRNQGEGDGRMRFGRGGGDEGRKVVGGLPISETPRKKTEEEEGSIPDPHRKQKQHRMLRPDSDWSQGSTNPSFSAGEGDMNVPGISSTQSPNQSGVRITTKTTKTTVTKKLRRVKEDGDRYGNLNEDPIRDVLSRDGKRLKVLIKAQQGTAIKISPSPTPPTGGHPARYSMDTEI